MYVFTSLNSLFLKSRAYPMEFRFYPGYRLRYEVILIWAWWPQYWISDFPLRCNVHNDIIEFPILENIIAVGISIPVFYLWNNSKSVKFNQVGSNGLIKYVTQFWIAFFSASVCCHASQQRMVMWSCLNTLLLTFYIRTKLWKIMALCCVAKRLRATSAQGSIPTKVLSEIGRLKWPFELKVPLITVG